MLQTRRFLEELHGPEKWVRRGPIFFDLSKMRLEMARILATRLVLVSCSVPSWLLSLASPTGSEHMRPIP